MTNLYRAAGTMGLFALGVFLANEYCTEPWGYFRSGFFVASMAYLYNEMVI